MFHFNKIVGLAGAALLFAGLASAQSTCTATPPVTTIDRAEGTTELLPQMTISCTGTGTPGTISLQLFFNLPVTSKVIGAIAMSDSGAGSSSTEAIVTGGSNVVPVQGTISGTTLNFTGIKVASGTFTLTVSNVRVNASSAQVTVGGPPQSASATAFISGSQGTINPAVLSFTNLAFLENGLAPAVISASAAGTSGKFNNPTVCTGNSPFTAFYIQVNENFPTAFKTASGEASQMAETGASSSNAVADGTRIQITFANVPANVSVYVPVAPIQSTNPTPATTTNDAITLTNSAPGTAFANVAASTTSSLVSYGIAPVTLSSGTGTATFETTVADPNNLGKFNIPIYLVNSAFAVPTGTTTGITATVSLAPTGSTVIPNFSTTSATTLTGSTFTLCSTSLLFPFVTNQLGFDTGIAIANTSTDPLGTLGATPQSGTCTLNFYGSGAPSPNSITTGSIGAGTTAGPVYAVAVSGLAAGFQGYMIAQCNFQYAHGFAFVTDGVGASGGLSQGYLAGVLGAVASNGARSVPESLGF